jgi:phage shock protein A
MATTRRVSSDVTDAINTISYRIEKTESDFLGHLQKVETKLEQIAELTRTVSLLQQQTNQQNEQIVEVRTQLRDQVQKMETSTSRLHTRIDEVANSTRDKLELASKEHELLLKNVDTKANNNEKEIKQWLNRGVGAFVILGLLGGAMQAGLYRWIDNIEKDRVKIEARLDSSITTVDKHTQQLEQLIALSKEQQLTNKRLEQLVFDLDKQVSRNIPDRR